MLGLYDSGLGGLTVLAALRRAGVESDVLYFADQAHVPYGDRSEADLYRLLGENLALLAEHDVEAIVMACNTSCAVAARRGGFPPVHRPILDLIANAAAGLPAAGLQRIAVVATAATVRSGAYRAAIARVAPALDVIEIAAPELVPLVEAGLAQSAQAHDAVRAVCAQLTTPVDAILYGCTHYPLLDAHFAAVLGARVARIDPAVAQAAATASLIAAFGLALGRGRTTYVTNGDVALFERNVRAWTGDQVGVVSSTTARATA
jgi:glutamate racemase